MGGDFDIWHVAIPVSDLLRSEDFYVRILGFELTGRQALPQRRQIFVRVREGGFTLLLFQSLMDSLGLPQRPDHLAFECAYIERFRARLVAAGLSYLPPVETLPSGVRRFALSDPDGLPLQFFQGRELLESALNTSDSAAN